ncbi:hypothetical protein CTEN210_09837 [Chaetoceros tenuissimus]|uniref:Laminin G domain-containing protein n=1 Tax=Chaetoceros tenuissimus TaxID=426638 RepID=A0AAD3CY93_9STRA|nr:hypothetical protein CTEN210_09837 [Chaetoceros tenuissimus]
MKINFLLVFPFLAARTSGVLSFQTDLTNNSEKSTSFVVIADMHSMSSFAFQTENESAELQNQWRSLTSILNNIKSNYSNTDVVMAPGDLSSFGQIPNKFIQDMTGIENENDAVYNATMTSYAKANELYQEAGFTKYLPCLGDHEIGGNKGFRVTGTKSKFASIDSYRKGWVDSFMKASDGEYKFNVDINGISSRPIGTDFGGTSYAYRYKNSLFISADVFRTIDNGNGTKNYIDRENGYGGEGAITCTMDDFHAQWFEHVLKAARSDVSIKHIFVEAHVPIQHPVRKARCSGQFLDDQTESQFWTLMEKYNVDIYFAGEVHATTVTKTKTVGSSLLQIVSSAKEMRGFLTVDTTDDTIVVKHFKEIGPAQRYNNDYSESGTLIIDKSNPDEVQITSSGKLEILDDSSALIHFNFEALHSMSERQVDEMWDDDSLVADNQIVGGQRCTESIHNIGTFGQQYDAQVANVELVQGRHNNTMAGKFSSSSRMAVFSIGPYTAGMAHSISFWMKSSQTTKEMILIYFGPNYKSNNKDTLRIILKNGRLRLRFSRRSLFQLSQNRILADDQWHHVAISMPFKSCKYSEIDVYIDGVKKDFVQKRGVDKHLFFHTDGRLNIGSYGYALQSSANDLLHNFEGEVDDVMVWSTALELPEVLMLSCQNGKRFKFELENGKKRKCAFLSRNASLSKNENRRRMYCKGDVLLYCPQACGQCE